MANPDLEELLNVLVPFAHEMLAKHGEFYPIGVSMDAKGEVSCVAGETGKEQADSQEKRTPASFGKALIPCVARRPWCRFRCRMNPPPGR
jgi:hypothetical protein